MNNLILNVRLRIHLPDEQQVYFTNDNAAEALMHSELKSIILIGWLNLNKKLIN